MALNLKAAMLILAAFVTGLCWFISRVALPATGELRPASIAGGDVRLSQAAQNSAASAGPFARQSAFDSQASTNLRAGGPLQVAEVPPTANESRSVVLPPLASHSNQLAAVTNDEPLEVRGAAGRVEPSSDPVQNTGDVADGPALAGGSEAPAVPAPRMREVRKGESLAKIARLEWRSSDARLVALLLEANPKLKGNPNKVQAGQSLVIPDQSVADRVMRGEKPAAALAAVVPAPAKSAEKSKTADKPKSKERVPEKPGPKYAAQPADPAAEQPIASADQSEASKTKSAGSRDKKPAEKLALETPAKGKIKDSGDSSKTEGKAPSAKVATTKSGERSGSKSPKADPKPAKADKALAKAKTADSKGKSSTSRDGKGQKVAQGPAADKSKPRYYTVQKQDSLGDIAERYLNDRRRWRELASTNGIKQPDKIAAGTRIKLPE